MHSIVKRLMSSSARKKSSKKPRSNSAAHRVQLESLERREMMAADVKFIASTGTVFIQGTNADDVVQVSLDKGSSETLLDDQVMVSITTDGQTQTHGFHRIGALGTPRVRQIQFLGNNGSDHFMNYTSVPCTVFGGKGNDYIIGGAGSDWLDGEGGRDTIHGGKGNDRIHGFSGQPSVREKQTDAADNLYGEEGRDTIYGGAGVDILVGGSGNDGLFGGAGVDVMRGDTGADRFLYQSGGGDVISDLHSNDAKIRFINSAPREGVRKSGDFFAAGLWNDSDIERVDGDLASLHERLGNTKLLKTADGSTITFVRLGESLNGDPKFSGWNAQGSIFLSDQAISSPDTVFHEIGHNWDLPLTNPDIMEFRSLSGWRHTTGVPDLNKYTRAGNTTFGWWFSKDAKFISDYAKTNPREDFAETFATSMALYEGRLPDAEAGGIAAINGADKLAVVDKLFEMLD